MKTENINEKDRWKPVSRGPIFCSPACGGGCTHAAYLDAHTNCKALCVHLGKGWTFHVWENLGWHYAAISPCGRIKVHPYDKAKPLAGATAFLGEKDFPGGKWAEQAKTPKAAVRKVIQRAKDDLATISAQIVGL